jgi:hypothetical protein
MTEPQQPDPRDGYPDHWGYHDSGHRSSDEPVAGSRSPERVPAWVSPKTTTPPTPTPSRRVGASKTLGETMSNIPTPAAARRFLFDVKALGGTPPPVLTNLVDLIESVNNTPAVPDPVGALVSAAVAGKAGTRGAEWAGRGCREVRGRSRIL